MIRLFAMAASLLSSSLAVVLAQSVDVPLTNWTVPTYRASSSSGGLTTMADVTPGIAFVGIQPCRVADTRGNGAPIQGGIFPNSGLRNWDVTGICGIPAGADAISVNFSVVSAAGTPQGAFLLAWPTGSPPAPGAITAVMTYGPGVTILSNAAIVPLGPGESLTVNLSHSTHVIMDVNGYFTDQYNPGVSFHVVSSNIAPAILGENTSTVADAVAIRGVTTSTGAGSSGVYGRATATGRNYGVFGQTNSPQGASAGVLGVDASGVAGNHTGENPAGVRGESHGFIGVLGISDNHIGVFGKVTLTGSAGYLGSGGYGVFSSGAFGGTGAKYFVEPHPEMPGLVVRFVSLEGNESGTYFRGRARFQNGLATILVPEEFRLVTDSENLSIQVTPIGQMATFAMESIGLDRIVVRGSRNVEFFYLVNGVRKTHKHLTPIGPGREYMPETPDARMPLYLTEGQKAMLISNGTYKADGTVNLETARRLGWDKEWEKRGQPARQPSD